MTEPTDKPLLDDQQLDEYLKGDSSVSRQYRQMSPADAPPSLDRLVLRQAEDAVKRSSRPVWLRWTAPLAVAASAVLVVSIVMQTGLRDETMVASKKLAEPAAPPPPPAAAPKAEAPPPVVYVDLNGPNAPAPYAPAMDIAIAPAPIVSTPAEVAAPAEAPAPAAPEMQQELAKSEEEDKASLAADASRQKFAREDMAREEERAVAQRATRTEQAQAAGATNAAPAVVLSYSSPIAASAVDNVATLKRAYTDPEAWLKDIRQLRKDNKPEEADREWRRFREAFPDFNVAETDAAREAKK